MGVVDGGGRAVVEMGFGKINCSIKLIYVETNIEGVELSCYFAQIFYANLVLLGHCKYRFGG